MARESSQRQSQIQLIAQNRRAQHDFEILDKLECGIALTGTEVKSLREHRISLDQAYAKIKDGEVWLLKCDIPEYSAAAYGIHDPKRPRKLLLHRREIARFAGKATQKGCTLIPLRMYFKNGWAKVELAVARGKKKYDKREKIKKEEAQRDIARALARRRTRK
ncbi:MAG: SsrA-binding protein SmpB [Gemmatales bacterium]|nr:SsrA-binding protein SmpB [Gemmatales bacterium]MDW8176797.1 SsrA-binding protein SmpB [Gemmatales bacterium]